LSTSVVRAIRILELLAGSDKPMPLAAIAEALDIPKSTAHVILHDLVAEAVLTCGKPPTYAVGVKAFEIGSAYLRGTGIAGVVGPELAHLTKALRFTAHYAILDGSEAVYLCKEDPPGLGVRLASSVGARLPSHLTAVGKASLAWLDDDSLAGHVSLKVRDATGQMVTIKRLAAELTQVRERGFATDDGQISTGIRCVAAPTFDAAGPRGAIGVSFLSDAAGSVDLIATEVMESAARVTSLLGGEQPA
jgi:DNA-binding IclR family transcriptional regulator